MRPGTRNTKKNRLDKRIAKYLETCPAAIEGQGGDNQTFTVACALVWGFGLSDEAALSWLRYYNQKCDPPWPDDELKRKIQNAIGAPSHRTKGYLIDEPEEDSQESGVTSLHVAKTPHASMPADPRWPSIVMENTDRIVSAGPWLYDLWERSPLRFEHPLEESKTVEIVGYLFPGDPLLCCGWSRSRFDTKRRLAWGDILHSSR
jgi:hypothetical protein